MFIKTYHHHIIQLLISIGFVIYAILLTNHDVIFKQPIFEKDPTISYPDIKEKFTFNTLIIISICIPSCFAILNIAKIIYKNKDDISKDPVKKIMLLTFWHIIGVSQTLLMSLAVSNTIRILVGKLRPNFFATCNYHNYTYALNSGNYTEYDEKTATGHIGNLENCLNNNYMDGFNSFPSIHSTLSFASLTYSYILMTELLDNDVISEKHGAWYSPYSIISFANIYLAGYISLTRIQDYKESIVDVLIGIFIGIISAYIAKKNYEFYTSKEVSKELTLQFTQTNATETLSNKLSSRLAQKLSDKLNNV
jgi:membrane-associated phospholipid phosphatase